MGAPPNPTDALVERAITEELAHTERSQARLLKEVSFERHRIMPPAALYVDGDDSLAITVYNSQANQKVKILGRILTPAGIVQPFQTIFQTNDVTRTAQPFTLTLDEGYLLNVTAESGATGTVRGQTYVQIGLRWATSPAGVRAENLVSDYVTDRFQPGWPPSNLRSPVDGPGGIISYPQSNPPAGSNFTFTVPAFTVQRFLSISFQLATSATVATRIPGLQIDDGTNIFYSYRTPVTQTASQTQRYTFSIGLGYEQTAFSANTLSLPAPQLSLYPGWRAQIIINNIQAGDQLQSIEAVVEEWIAP